MDFPLGLNSEQLKSFLRWGLATVGSSFGTYLVTKGVLTADQVTSLTSTVSVEALALFGVTVVGLGWGLATHTQANVVKVVDAMPEVEVVVTKPTAAGQKLAKAVASPTVVVADKKEK